MSKKNVIFFMVILAGIALLIFFLYLVLFKPNRQDKLADQKELKIEQIIIGEVVAVGERQITIKTEGDILSLPGERQEFDLFKVQINKEADILRYTDAIKSREQFAREQEEFNKKVKEFQGQGASITGIEAPNWNILKKVNFNNIAKGDIVRAFVYKIDDSYIAKKVIVELNKKLQAKSNLQSQQDKILKIFGTISAWQSDRLKLQIYKPTGLAAATEFKEIVINSQTDIIKKIKKTEEQFQREQLEFNNQVKQLKSSGVGINDLIAPSWFIIEEIDVNNLAIRQDITADVIENNGQLIARQIEIISQEE